MRVRSLGQSAMWTFMHPGAAHSRPPIRRPATAVRVVVVASSTAGLIGFHALLLWQRFADSSIYQPAVMAKWIAGVAFILAALLFDRFAPRHLRGARALFVFLLLALVLHLGAPFAKSSHDLQAELVSVAQIALVVPAALIVAFLLSPPAPAYAGAIAASRRSPATAWAVVTCRDVAPRAPPFG